MTSAGSPGCPSYLILSAAAIGGLASLHADQVLSTVEKTKKNQKESQRIGRALLNSATSLGAVRRLTPRGPWRHDASPGVRTGLRTHRQQ